MESTLHQKNIYITMDSENSILKRTNNQVIQEKQQSNRDLVNDNINISDSVSLNDVYIKTEPTHMAHEVMSTNKCYDIRKNNINNPICKNEFIVKSEFVSLNEEPSSSICNDVETVYIKQENIDEDMFSEEEQNELLDTVDYTKIKCENERVDKSGSSTGENLDQMIDIKPYVAGHLNVNNVSTVNETSSSESDERWESLANNKCIQPTTTKSLHLIGHSNVHSEEKLFKCDQCDKGFPISSRLIKHKRVHSGEKPFKCVQCNKAFSQLSNLNRHIRVHYGDRPFNCDQCDKVFSQASNLNEHKRIHSGEKPFKCDQCDKVFSLSSNLNRHKRVHSGVKSFKCDQCDKTFSQLASSKRHKRVVHSRDKSFSCEECGKAFSRSSKLNKHKRIHSGFKPFICDKCDKVFAQLSRFIKHKRLHSGNKPFNCDV